MCLILFAYKHHPRYKLILAANRDEFYQRPTAMASYWEDTDILAGRDLEAMGTWMGVTKTGRIAMLTNYRGLNGIKTNAPSRGNLVTDFLLGGTNGQEYLQGVEQNGQAYNGFNIITGTADNLTYYGNYQKGVHHVESGIHGLSNALLNTPWPKVVSGKQQLEKIISEEFDEEHMFELLKDEVLAADDQLPETGVGYEKEKMLSPRFIKSNNYGTRCSTVILITHTNEFVFTERTYNTDNFSFEDRSFQGQF